MFSWFSSLVVLWLLCCRLVRFSGVVRWLINVLCGVCRML